MGILELPHTAGCLVCGRDNSLGLKLSLFVDESDGTVHVPFTPTEKQCGFEGIVHGGVLATVLDEAMVWAATWANRRFCVCGELNARYRRPGRAGMRLAIEARIIQQRARLIRTQAVAKDETGAIICEAGGSYMPMDDATNQRVIASFVDEPATRTAAQRLMEVPCSARS